MQDPLNIRIDYPDGYQEGDQNKASEFLRKRKSSKKHSDGTTKKAKTSSSARKTLDTSAKELKVVVATLSAGTILSKFVPSKNNCQYLDNNSSFSSTIMPSPTNNLNTFGSITNPRQITSITTHVESAQSEQLLFEKVLAEPPISASRTINPNVTIPFPTPQLVHLCN